MKAGLIIIYKDGSSNMHGIDQDETFLNTAFFETGIDLRSNVYKLSPFSHIKP
jgi:hypothetical protein